MVNVHYIYHFFFTIILRIFEKLQCLMINEYFLYYYTNPLFEFVSDYIYFRRAIIYFKKILYRRLINNYMLLIIYNLICFRIYYEINQSSFIIFYIIFLSLFSVMFIFKYKRSLNKSFRQIFLQIGSSFLPSFRIERNAFGFCVDRNDVIRCDSVMNWKSITVFCQILWIGRDDVVGCESIELERYNCIL